MKLIVAKSARIPNQTDKEDHEQQPDDQGAARVDAQGQHQPPQAPQCEDLRAKHCQGGRAGVKGKH